MPTLHKLHVVYLRRCLDPFEPVCITELHPMRHNFKSNFNQRVPREFHVVALTEVCQFFNWLLFLIFFNHLAFIVKQWSIEVTLVVPLLQCKNTVLAGSPLQIVTRPLVDCTMASADTIEPCFDWFKVELDAMVWFRLKPKTVKVFNRAPLPPRTNRLLPSLAPSVNLYMNHIMLLCLQLRVVICATVENKVSRLHLLKSQVNRQGVVLVGLIPSV
jgi:hypothetical protein